MQNSDLLQYRKSCIHLERKTLELEDQFQKYVYFSQIPCSCSTLKRMQIVVVVLLKSFFGTGGHVPSTKGVFQDDAENKADSATAEPKRKKRKKSGPDNFD
jgi:hypothetical protein